ncbi:guanine deaminase [Parathielavia hyrcaniae]|uniref:Probable guanine deaminase n=1 Tax=Parathielavia hyrcaniae TaxID=113614 RepID=A0AAN6Q2U6_9PEZI|nr:guanine deaminase [Parathielavia hyrcaniae]
MAQPGKVFLGPLVHSVSLSELEIIPFAAVAVNHEGSITSVHRSASPPQAEEDTGPAAIVHRLASGRFLVPGFVDTHNHAPQWAQRGLGQGMHILDWLDAITFPNEARFADPSHARRVYASCVDGFLRQGVTTASYYGSVHGEATKILAGLCLDKGQRALVGKCNMTRNAPDSYRDASVGESLRATEDCIAHIRALDPAGRLVRHVLTPRFAISCHPELLRGLGELARANPDLPVQTHFNEAEQEMAATRELFPQFAGSEADLYEHYGLLGERSILAHCCHKTEYELRRLEALGCGVAHCPVSNMTFLRRGIKVGLGTDSGGGFSSSILDAMRQAMIASHAREIMSEGRDKGLSVGEVFYLATVGGAQVCGLGDRIGNFEVGKEFDAIVVGTQGAEQGIMIMVEEEDSLRTVFKKFVMTGDDRNMVEVYVQGRLVKGRE